MTTTLTIETTDWPVSVTQTTTQHSSDDQHESYSHSSTSEFVPPNTKRTYLVSDTTGVSVNELAKDATGLATPQAATAQA